MALRLFAWRAGSHLRVLNQGFSTAKDNHLRFTSTHEWVKVDGTSATVGLTDQILGKWCACKRKLHVILPQVGTSVQKDGDGVFTVLVDNTAVEISSPVSGKVVQVNEMLSKYPSWVNIRPYDKGWVVKVEMSDEKELDSLMDSEEYPKFCKEVGMEYPRDLLKESMQSQR